jgi:hypothetical protein
MLIPNTLEFTNEDYEAIGKAAAIASLSLDSFIRMSTRLAAEEAGLLPPANVIKVNFTPLNF